MGERRRKIGRILAAMVRMCSFVFGDVCPGGIMKMLTKLTKSGGIMKKLTKLTKSGGIIAKKIVREVLSEGI